MKKLIMLLFIIFIMMSAENVDAKYSIDANSYGANLTSCRAYSSRTGKGYFACLINGNDMGYRVTIINKNGIRVSSKSIDLFSTEAYNVKKDSVLKMYNDKINSTCNVPIIGDILCEFYNRVINSMVSIYKDGYLLTGFGSINMKNITNEKYRSNNSNYFGTTTTKFVRTSLGAQQKLNTQSVLGISGFSTMKNKIINGNLFTYILNSLGISEQNFINNEYKILLEPIYMVSYTPHDKTTDNPVELTKNDIDESMYYYGTANEVAKFLYDELTTRKSKVINTNYLNGVLVNVIPNLAFNMHTNDVVENSIVGYSTQNYSASNHYNLVYGSLKKLYTTYGYGIGIISYDEIPKFNGSLVIIKQDEKGNQIKKKATFRLYKGSNCNEKNKFSSDISVTGSLTKKLVFGNYSIKEINAPDGYTKDSTCHNFTIKSPVTSPTSVRVTNKIKISGCEAEFQGISNNRYARIQLYDKYPKNTNLLNFSIKDAKTACSPATCSSNPNVSCFDYSYETSNFSKDNLSCATIEKITDSSKIGSTHTVFCGVDYSLDNTLNLNGNNLGTVQPGMMVLNLNKDSVVAKLNAVERCYIYYPPEKTKVVNDFKTAYQNNPVIIDTNPEITLDDKGLPKKLSDQVLYENNTNNNYIERKYSATINYYLNPVYATIGIGELCDTNEINNDCRLLGYGFISKLNAKNYSGTGFTIDTKFHDVEVVGCTYKISSKLPIENLQFRSINKTNPFIGKDGNGRTTGSNWCSENDCSSTNETVKNIILDRNDSYNSTGDGPIYRIELKPDDIKTIRQNYSGKKYDEFYLDCDQNATNCKSLLLENLKTKGLIEEL